MNPFEFWTLTLFTLKATCFNMKKPYVSVEEVLTTLEIPFTDPTYSHMLKQTEQVLMDLSAMNIGVTTAVNSSGDFIFKFNEKLFNSIMT